MISILKSEKVKIIADVIEWPVDSGTMVLDIRTHVQTKTSGTKYIPTGKGVQIPFDEAERFASRMLKMVKSRQE